METEKIFESSNLCQVCIDTLIDVQVCVDKNKPLPMKTDHLFCIIRAVLDKLEKNLSERS